MKSTQQNKVRKNRGGSKKEGENIKKGAKKMTKVFWEADGR